MPKPYDSKQIYDSEEESAKPQADADGSHDDLDLSDAENEAFDDIADNYGEEAPSSGGFYKGSGGSEKPEKSDTSSGEATLEAAKERGEDNKEPGFRNKVKGAQSKAKGIKGRLNKKRLAIASAVSAFIVPIIAIVALMLVGSALKLPHVAEQVTTYNLAKTARSYRASTAEINATNAALGEADDAVVKTWKQSIRDSTWGKLDKYRPEKLVSNMKADNRIQYIIEEKPRTLGLGSKRTIKGIIIDGQEIAINENKFGKFLGNYQNSIRANAEITAAMDRATLGSPSIIRSKSADIVRESVGLKLQWWKRFAPNYRGKTSEEIKRLAQEEANSLIKTPPTEGSSAKINEAAKELDESVATCVKDTACAKEVIDGEPTTIRNKLGTLVKESGLEKGVGYASTIYAVAFPLCMIYDGSIQKAGPLIDNNNKALQRSFYSVSTGADQAAAGEASGPALEGMNDRLGDISGSIAQQRGSGEVDQISLDTAPNPQASATGEFTAFNALLGKNAASDGLSSVADTVCPVLTNVWVGLGLGAIELAFAFLTGGSSEIGAGAAKGGAEIVVKESTEGIFKRMATAFTGKFAAKEASVVVVDEVAKITLRKKLLNFGTKVVRDVAIIEAGTLLMRAIVSARANTYYNGLSRDGALINEADAGGAIHGNELCRKMQYCRPLTKEEVVADATETKRYLAQEQQNLPASQRYFALSNPSSLLSTVAVNTNNQASIYLKKPQQIFTSLLSSISGSFKQFGALALSGNQKMAFAASPESANPYHLVMFAWTPGEEALAKTAPYQFVNNEIALKNKNLDAIEEKYGKCFDPEKTGGSIGSLLAEEAIVRDKSGDVVADDGICSPENLGPNNPTEGDLVFRWRLSKRYENTLDHLNDLSEITPESDDVAPTPGGDIGNPVTVGSVTCPENLEAHPTLAGYFKMPTAPNNEYHIYSTQARRYGSKQLVCVLYTVGMAYSKVYPGKSYLDIGDLNASGHKSHNWGVAVDLDANGQIRGADHTKGSYSTEATITLGKMFIDTGVIRNIWWCDPGDGSLDAIKAYAVSKGTPLKGAKCIEGHANHFHVDINAEFRLQWYTP